MKNIKTLFFLILSLTSLVSCSYEEEIGSNITNYAVIKVDPIKVIALGGNYTATAEVTENNLSIPYTIVGDDEVDENTVGIYDVTFSATNQDGFTSSKTQTVVVHNPNIIGTDVSGEVRDKTTNSRKATISLVEGTTSIFYSTDFGFAGVFPMYFQMNGNTISEIKQHYSLNVESVDLTYDPVAKIFTTFISPNGFSYTFEYY